MIMKIIALLLVLGIIYSMGSAAYYMISKKNDPEKLAKALAWRISLSIILFLTLMVGAWFGWIHLHGIAAN